MPLLRAHTGLGHVKEVRLNDIDTLSFLDFRLEDERDEDFVGLMTSVRKHGLLQPVIVRPSGSARGSYGSRDIFELVSGRRRFVACKRLQFHSIPCLVMELDDREAFEVALVENVQRRTLDPIEEAEAFKSYVVNYGRGSVTRLAERICKSEEYVSHRLLLLGLPKPLLDRISRRLLSPSHATELVWLKDKKEQLGLAEEIAKHNLSLRQLRSVIKEIRTKDVSIPESVKNVLQIAEGEIRASKHGRSEGVDFPNENWLNSSERLEGTDSDGCLRTLNRAILVMKSALAGIDSLAEETSNSQALRTFLLKERYEVHTTLDELVKAKVSYRRYGTIESFPV